MHSSYSESNIWSITFPIKCLKLAMWHWYGYHGKYLKAQIPPHSPHGKCLYGCLFKHSTWLFSWGWVVELVWELTEGEFISFCWTKEKKSTVHIFSFTLFVLLLNEEKRLWKGDEWTKLLSCTMCLLNSLHDFTWTSQPPHESVIILIDRRGQHG